MESPWQYSTVHNSACKVIEEQTLWGQMVCRVWLPNQDAVVRVVRSALRPLSADLQPEIEAGRVAYVAAAAKVAEVLEGSTSATKELPTANARHSDWTALAMKWAELISLVHCGNHSGNDLRLKETGKRLNATFADWLTDHYSSLINLPPTQPAMLHHVARRLARDIEDGGSHRMALIVVDGLALDQWVTIRGLLQKQDADLVMRESATFAWIPTLTSVSR